MVQLCCCFLSIDPGIADNGVATDASKKVKKEKAQSKKKPTTNGAKSTDATAVKGILKYTTFSWYAPVLTILLWATFFRHTIGIDRNK